MKVARVPLPLVPGARAFPCPGCGRVLPAVRRTDRDLTVCVGCTLDEIERRMFLRRRARAVRRIDGEPMTCVALPRPTPRERVAGHHHGPGILRDTVRCPACATDLRVLDVVPVPPNDSERSSP